jgi:ribonuclease BN (tRNA processing enzyme)
VQISVLGVGEASDPDHPNSSVTVASGGYRLLIDCGHSVPPVLWRRFPDPETIDALIFTHHHPDHCFGLVPWLISLADDGRRRPLPIVTTLAGMEHLKRLCEIGMVAHDSKSPFPIEWLNGAETDKLGPFSIRRAPTTHSVVNHAIRLSVGDKRFAFSGDGKPTAESRALVADATLLLQECYMAQAPDMKYHADIPTVRGIAGPPRIGLYHIRKDQRLPVTAELAGDSRLFVVQAGDELTVGAD